MSSLQAGWGAWLVPTLPCMACTEAAACMEAASRPCSSSSCSSSSCSSVGSKLYMGISWWRSFSSLGVRGRLLGAWQALLLPPALRALPDARLSHSTQLCLGDPRFSLGLNESYFYTCSTTPQIDSYPLLGPDGAMTMEASSVGSMGLPRPGPCVVHSLWGPGREGESVTWSSGHWDKGGSGLPEGKDSSPTTSGQKRT